MHWNVSFEASDQERVQASIETCIKKANHSQHDFEFKFNNKTAYSSISPLCTCRSVLRISEVLIETCSKKKFFDGRSRWTLSNYHRTTSVGHTAVMWIPLATKWEPLFSLRSLDSADAKFVESNHVQLTQSRIWGANRPVSCNISFRVTSGVCIRGRKPQQVEAPMEAFYDRDSP